MNRPSTDATTERAALLNPAGRQSSLPPLDHRDDTMRATTQPRTGRLHAAYAKDTMFLKTVLLTLLLALITCILMAPPNTADAQEATVSPQPGNNCAAT